MIAMLSYQSLIFYVIELVLLNMFCFEVIFVNNFSSDIAFVCITGNMPRFVGYHHFRTGDFNNCAKIL